MTLIISAADAGIDIDAISARNDHADLTLIVGSTSAAADPMPLRFLFVALGDLATKLANMDPRFQWRRTHFLIRDRGKIVGKGVFTKTPMAPPDLASFLRESVDVVASVAKS